MKTGVELIAEERLRQIQQEGFTTRHDEEHDKGQLSVAGALYAIHASYQTGYHHGNRSNPPIDWPFGSLWWKPKADPIANLVRAGAMIAAEIDRLQRKRRSIETDGPTLPAVGTFGT